MIFSNYINSSNFSNQLPTLSLILPLAQASVNFWGARVITSTTFEGSVSLNELSKKILSVACLRSKADDLSTKERVAGIDVVKDLRKFYKITDTAISKANWFTRFLNYVREFTFSSSTPRFETEKGLTEKYFRGYSESKYSEEFVNYAHFDGSFGPPIRMLAKEDAIRSKLSD